MYVPKSALVTLVTLSSDVVVLTAVTRLVSTGLPSRSQEKVKLVVPTQSTPVQVSVRGSPTLRSGSEGVTLTEGGATWRGVREGEKREWESRTQKGMYVCMYVHFKHTHAHHSLVPCDESPSSIYFCCSLHKHCTITEMVKVWPCGNNYSFELPSHLALAE